MKNLTCLCALVVLASGCHQCGPKTQKGWRFEVMQPPVVEQSTPMLVQQGPGMLSAQPIGAVAGPVYGGQWQHAAPMQMAPCVIPPAAPLAAPQAAPCTQAQYAAPAPAAAPRGLTCEEWCELMRQMQQRNLLPMPNREQKKPPEEE